LLPIPVTSTLHGSLRSFLAKDNSHGVTNLFPFTFVSLGFAASVLTAPVTHRDQGLQPFVFFFFLCGPYPLLRTQKILGSRPCPIVSFAGFMVVNQPLVAHGVGGQDVDDLMKPGWNG
jgi:hypothetical protein